MSQEWSTFAKLAYLCIYSLVDIATKLRPSSTLRTGLHTIVHLTEFIRVAN